MPKIYSTRWLKHNYPRLLAISSVPLNPEDLTKNKKSLKEEKELRMYMIEINIFNCILQETFRLFYVHVQVDGMWHCKSDHLSKSNQMLSIRQL